MFEPSSNLVLLTVQGGASFMDYFVILCFVFICHFILSVHCNLMVNCLEKAALLALLYVMVLCFCHFPIWCHRSGVVFDCIVFFVIFLT